MSPRFLHNDFITLYLEKIHVFFSQDNNILSFAENAFLIGEH